MLFYDFEVFKHDWLVVIFDTEERKEHVIVNDIERLTNFYQKHNKDVWIGYNSRHYDQYVMKAILAGFTPQEMNDWIINKKKPGWKFSKALFKIKFYNFDIMIGFNSLKQLEAFMGHDIQETTVSFDIERKLTDEELEQVIFYCRHDAMETMQVFKNRVEEYTSQMALLKAFDLPLKNISKTKAQLSAIILNSQNNTDRTDEMNFSFPDTLDINKYNKVISFYKNTNDYKDKLEIEVAGVPHIFAWGGLHGARKNYCEEGYFVNVDVESYYPALMIEYDYGSRNIKDANKYRKIRDTRLKLKAKKDPNQAPYKIVLNSTYGAMKDRYNGLYDPRQANNVCIAGMTLLLDLIEKLEPHCDIIQSNTDGVLVKLRKESDFELIDDICYEWEQRTHMVLEFDVYKKVIQKDVNNYIVVDHDGNYKSKGAYVKKLNELDNDLPILNKALINYFIHSIPVEETINTCTELIMFQKVVKISSKYEYAVYGQRRQSEKVFRVFASKSDNDKELKKVKDGSHSKIAYTPDKCFIDNGEILNKKIPTKLDRGWYVDMANKRIKDFIG